MSPDQERIDAHQHFWDGTTRDHSLAAHEVFATPYGPREVVGELAAAGIDGTVLIQSRNAYAENEALAQYASEAEFVRGIVYYVPLSAGKRALPLLEEVATLPRACGVRCLVAGDPLEWAVNPASSPLWRSMAEYSLCWEIVPITPAQLRAVAAVARENPELRVVIDHLGRPPIPGKGFEPWSSLTAELSRAPNVAMKVSVGVDVLESWQHWDATALERYIRHVIEHFGEERLMLASNWPVVLMRANYGRAVRDLSAVVRRVLGEHGETSAIFGATAASVFRLGERR